MSSKNRDHRFYTRIAGSNLLQFFALSGSLGVLAIWFLVALELFRRQEILLTIGSLVLTPLLTPIFAWWINATLGAWAVGFMCTAIVCSGIGRHFEISSQDSSGDNSQED